MRFENIEEIIDFEESEFEGGTYNRGRSGIVKYKDGSVGFYKRITDKIYDYDRFVVDALIMSKVAEKLLGDDSNFARVGVWYDENENELYLVSAFMPGIYGNMLLYDYNYVDTEGWVDTLGDKGRNTMNYAVALLVNLHDAHSGNVSFDPVTGEIMFFDLDFGDGDTPYFEFDDVLSHIGELYDDYNNAVDELMNSKGILEDMKDKVKNIVAWLVDGEFVEEIMNSIDIKDEYLRKEFENLLFDRASEFGDYIEGRYEELVYERDWDEWRSEIEY